MLHKLSSRNYAVLQEYWVEIKLVDVSVWLIKWLTIYVVCIYTFIFHNIEPISHTQNIGFSTHFYLNETGSYLGLTGLLSVSVSHPG